MAYVYALCEPGSGEIRCIGQTHLQLSHRLKLYLSGAHKGRSHTSCWLRKLMREGKIPTIIELERVYGDQGFLDQAEISWIAYGRATGLRLTNLLPGGGGHRHSRTESFKRKQRKPKSDAQRVNMSAARKRLIASGWKMSAQSRQRANEGGELGRHARWHTNRGVKDLDCPYCQ